MLKILLSGCNGQMGRAISELAKESSDITVTAGIDKNTEKLFGYTVYADISMYGGSADVLIDFSNPSSLAGILEYCIKNGLPAILATTGYSEQQIYTIEDAAKSIPIFKTANMSLGINLLSSLAKQAAKFLGYDYNIEIIESHHNRKVDSPSGTALAIADALKAALPSPPDFVYGRHGTDCKRAENEIGIHAIRGGTIVGEHTVMFAGRNEVIEISHSASSRTVFASGALKAAAFIRNKPAGLYNMEDLIEELI